MINICFGKKIKQKVLSMKFIEVGFDELVYVFILTYALEGFICPNHFLALYIYKYLGNDAWTMALFIQQKKILMLRR